MKRDLSPIRVPVMSPVPRFPIKPTRREESERERMRRRPKYPHRDDQ